MFNMLNMLLLYSCMLNILYVTYTNRHVMYSDDVFKVPIGALVNDLTDGGNDDHSANNEESEPEFTNKCGML